MKTSLLFFVSLFLVVHAAHAQIRTGTIIVFELAKDKFAIAADSRAIFSDRPPEDNHCKIAAFKSNDVIFAAGNATGYPNRGIADFMPSWDVVDEARRAVDAERVIKRTNATDAANGIVSLWENNMLARWTQMMLYHPEDVRYIAAKNEGHLTHGVFAVARAGSIAIALTSIVDDNGKLRAERAPVKCPVGEICATGKLEIFKKYITAGKKFMVTDPPLSRVIKLVELTIAEDKSGTVHGPIDAVELLNDGTIQWRHKKSNCPENSD
jgi:hypothetical protein